MCGALPAFAALNPLWIWGWRAGPGMSDEWIAKNLGMDTDEILRLKQISGIAALFKDRDFNRAWAANIQDAAQYPEGDD